MIWNKKLFFSPQNIDNELVNLNGEVGQIDGVKENMKKILRSANLDSYYVYLGSLTTPPCNERVTWFVFTTPINMSYQFVSLCHWIVWCTQYI